VLKKTERPPYRMKEIFLIILVQRKKGKKKMEEEKQNVNSRSYVVGEESAPGLPRSTPCSCRTRIEDCFTRGNRASAITGTLASI
jgi:hypothetical protein